jgi:DNA-binding NarL/FixJ family response regulator
MKPFKCRVLLVDDHVPTRETLRSLLQPYDDVQIMAEAGDGIEALEMLAMCRPDVILLDLNMPRMNGIEAAGLIKKSAKDTVIIGLCAIQDTYTTDAFLRAGALAVISKDRFDDLYSTIQRACKKTSPNAYDD